MLRVPLHTAGSPLSFIVEENIIFDPFFLVSRVKVPRVLAPGNLDRCMAVVLPPYEYLSKRVCLLPVQDMRLSDPNVTKAGRHVGDSASRVPFDGATVLHAHRIRSFSPVPCSLSVLRTLRKYRRVPVVYNPMTDSFTRSYSRYNLNVRR